MRVRDNGARGWARRGWLEVGLLLVVLSGVGCGRREAQKVALPGGDGPGVTETGKAPVAGPGVEAPRPVATAAPAKPGGWPVAEKVVAANLDGEGDDELVVWAQGRLSIWAQDEQPIELSIPRAAGEDKVLGGPARMVVADADGDGREEVFLAYGMTREQRDAPVTLAVLGLKGKSGAHERWFEVLYQVSSSRPDPTGLQVTDLDGDGKIEVLLAHYDSKYFVSSYRLGLPGKGQPLKGPLPVSLIYRARMAASWAAGKVGAEKKPLMLVGRPYGEEKLAPGDLFQLEGQSRVTIPTRLGVRSLAVGDGDGDGRSEVYFGDGWHFDYGKVARGRLSVARKGPKGWESSLIEETRGQYEVGQLEVGDVDGDGKPELLAAGDRYIGVYWKTPQGWMTRKLSDGDAFAVARLRGEPALVVPGTPLRVVSLRAARQGGAPVSKDETPFPPEVLSPPAE